MRRAAIGVVQPLIEHDISFDLREAVSKAAKLQPIAVSDEVQNQVLDFITGRLSVVLKDAGYKYDVVDAVLAEQSANPAKASSDVTVKQLQMGRRVRLEYKFCRDLLDVYVSLEIKRSI